MTPQEIKKKVLSLLADVWDELGADKGLDGKEIATRLNTDLKKTENAILTLLTLKLVDMCSGFSYVHLTPDGYAQARPNDSTVPRSGDFSVSFGSVSQSAVSFQNSTATVNITLDALFQNLISEIEKHPSIPPEEKKSLVQNIQGLTQHPIVAGILSSLVAGLIQGAG